MEDGASFVGALHMDLLLNILSLLDDPRDLVCASAVSHTWRHVVISNGLCKALCLRKIPQFTHVSYRIENVPKILDIVTFKNAANWRSIEREHKIFSALLRYFWKPESPRYLVAFALGASRDTLHPDDSSDWSSEGQSDSDAPENLVYRLNSSISIVNEICIQPLEVLSEDGHPVYSPKAVRFHMGHPKPTADIEINIFMIHKPFLDKYEWTYTSPLFPMTQDLHVQSFKLPEPVCVGGVIQIELLGRAKKDNVNGLFYIRLGNVKFMGLNIEPDFYAQMYSSSGELQLTYNHKSVHRYVPVLPEPENDMGPGMSEEMCEELADDLFDFLDDDDED